MARTDGAAWTTRMAERAARFTTRWGGVQRRVRLLVPRRIRTADLALFRILARTRIPVIGPLLPRLSHAANHSRLWMAIAGVLGVVDRRVGRRAGARGLLAIGVTSTVTNLPAKLLTGRVRPDLSVVPEIRRLARVPTSTSFPSGHSAAAFAFATGVALEEPRLRVPLFALASAVATSRVYTGVHYPGDVLVGSAIGVAVARATTRPWPLSDDQPATAEETAQAITLPEPDGTGLVLVDNLGAGTGRSARLTAELRRALPGIAILQTEPGEGLTVTLRRAASQARVLAVAGGDGTASAAAAVAEARGIPLTVLPAGTLNHLATDLGLERVETVVRAVRSGRIIRMDLGVIDGQTFVNAASAGAYPGLVAMRERLEGRIGKWPAAVWSMLRTLARNEPVDIEIDGQRRRVWLLFVGNGRYVAESIAPARRSRLDDGALDVRLVDAETGWARTRVVLSVLTGRLGRCASYERWTTDHLHVRSLQGPLRLATDGEQWTSSTEFAVAKQPRSLMVLQPEP